MLYRAHDTLVRHRNSRSNMCDIIEPITKR
jgi:hypothetical protein